jgi:acyl-CoA synthetase (AMP-forming)/AMP-acid ligase II
MRHSVASAFLDAVTRHGASPALVDQDKTWTYAELGQLTLAVTEFIGSMPLRRGDRIALVLQNSAEYVATYFATQLSGCAVVALNTQEPAPVLSGLIAHCKASLLFVDSRFKDLKRLRELLGANGPQVVEIGSESAIWREIKATANGDSPGHIAEVKDEDLASIIYTSGTTGNPKGVMLSHCNLSANTESILGYIDIGPDDRTFNVLPFYYSFGNSVLLTHLSVGASVILQNNIAFPHAVMKRMGDERATGFYGVPTTFTLLFDTERIEASDLTALRYIAQAGGPMSVDKQQQLARDLPGVRIIVMYGQTEATARLTYLDPDRLHDKFGSAGKAIPGVELRIGHSEDEVHSPEYPGEICARGDNIMMGYWKNAAATNEVINDGWLLTGDLGYFDSEGFLYITGRASDMIKTGANRVSPAEIEDVIARLEEVSEVGAYPVDDDVLGQAIAVAIVLVEGADMDVKAIQRFCLAEMSPYKVPRYIRFVSELPKTASGKLKRHILVEEYEESKKNE